MVGRPLLAAALVLAASTAACRDAPEPAVLPMPVPDRVEPWIAAAEPPTPVASYRIRASFDPDKHRIRGSQVLTWRNTGREPVTTLPFHLYMNAFKNEASVFMRESGGRHRRAEAEEGAWGWIDVTSIQVGGGGELVSRARFPGPDETVLEVPLDQPVAPGDSVEVSMVFEVQLPRVFARTGYAGDFTMVGQWFPKIGVRVPARTEGAATRGGDPAPGADGDPAPGPEGAPVPGKAGDPATAPKRNPAPGKAADPATAAKGDPAPGKAADPATAAKGDPAQGRAADPAAAPKRDPAPGKKGDPAPGKAAEPAPGSGSDPAPAVAAAPAAPEGDPAAASEGGGRAQETWHAEPFHLESEFFADFGDYEVSLTVPDTHVVAATGVLVKAVDDPGGIRTLTYRARGVHDFAWMADPFMQSIARTAKTENGPVEVRVYFREPQRAFAERHLAAGVAAIEGFSRMLVPYPWARMTIIDPPPEAADGAGGMEYPTLVTTAADSVLAPEGVRLPEFVTVHEVGHNWFQGILASNEVDEAWLDEGMNDYIDAVLMDEVYGAGTSMIDWGPFHAGVGALRTARGPALRAYPDPIATRSYDFADFRSYAGVTYGKTAAAMATLEHAIGSERFRAALRAYAREMAFRHPTEADLIRVLERELGQDLDWFLGPALHEIGAADLRVRSIECNPAREPAGVFGRGKERKVVAPKPAEGAGFRCRVQVANLGRVPVPVDIELGFADGRRVRRRWDDRGRGPRWHLIEVEDDSEVVEVVIDPDRRVLLDDGGLYRSLRVVPRGGAARRAAAHGQFWTQTAMQVLGL